MEINPLNLEGMYHVWEAEQLMKKAVGPAHVDKVDCTVEPGDPRWADLTVLLEKGESLEISDISSFSKAAEHAVDFSMLADGGQLLIALQFNGLIE